MYGFLGVGNGMLNAFQDIINKAQNVESLKKVMSVFAYSIDVVFLIGLLLAILGLLIAGIEFYISKQYSDDDDKMNSAKTKFKRSLIASCVFLSIPLLVTIIGFAIVGSGALG